MFVRVLVSGGGDWEPEKAAEEERGGGGRHRGTVAEQRE